MSNSGIIFNIPEARGSDQVEFETTAANAQLNAPTAPIAREVEANAEHAKAAAHKAAVTAQPKGASLTGNTPSALDQFQQQASKTLDSAVAQGQHDVGAAKSTIGTEYVDQAKALAASAVNTAQSYLPDSVGGQTKSPNGTSGPGVVSSLQSGATAAVETAKEYLNAAQESTKPHIEATKEYLTAAQETVQPHIESAKGVAQGYLGTAGTQGKSPVPSKDIPATSAPLESGPHSVDTPYPSTTAAMNIGQNKDSLAS